MLVLTRKSGEAVVIGDSGEVVVTVLSIEGSEVRIAIETLGEHRTLDNFAVPIELLSSATEDLCAGEAA
jgi:hypothetical protein